MGTNGLRMGVLHVTSTKKPPYRCKVNIRSPWLADLGFSHGSAVTAVPQQDGFTLTLKNTVNENGKLIHVGLGGDAKNKPALSLNFANNFSTTGLSGGDFLAAGYEYGVITARKLPDAQKYYVVGARNHGAFLRLNGAWLSNAEFLPDSIAIVAVDRDCIILQLWNDTASSYGEIVKFARMHKCQILQVQKNQHIIFIDLDAHILHRAGFEPGCLSGVHYDCGIIKLFKPDLRKLGF